MRRITALTMAGITGALLTASAPGQEDRSLAPGYIPLFTPQQIENASPETRQRMIDTERVNRETWAERTRKRTAGSGEGPAREGAGGDEGQSAADARATAQPAPRRKIYRWVDEDGRINFGDSPPSTAASEVKLRRDAAPTPAAVTGDSDVAPAPGRPVAGTGSD